MTEAQKTPPATTEETKPTETKADPPKGEPAKAPAAEEKKPESKTPAAETKGGDAPKARRMNDDDEIPDDEQLLELSTKALKNRLTRYTKKELKAHFGTDSIEEIKSKLAKADEYETKEEESRRAKLDEKARSDEDLKKANERAEKAEIRAQAIEDDRVFERQDVAMSKIAEKFLDPDYVDVELPKFARWLLDTYSQKELEKGVKASDIDKYFEERIAAKPKLAREYAPESQKETPKVGVTSGANTNAKPTAGSSTDTQKTFAPGKANSMSSAESKAAMRKLGINY